MPTLRRADPMTPLSRSKAGPFVILLWSPTDKEVLGRCCNLRPAVSQEIARHLLATHSILKTSANCPTCVAFDAAIYLKLLFQVVIDPSRLSILNCRTSTLT